MKAIEIDHLTKSYGKSRGISDVSLSIEEGEIYGFIGPNGAGKSTTIKLLLNLIYPTNGSAKIFNMDVVNQTATIKKSLGYVPSEVRYYPSLTGEELMKTTLRFHNSNNIDEIHRLCELLDIDKKKKIGDLSLGNKKKIAIACALIHEPKLIILDEPTSGLDPLIQKRLFELLKAENKKGTTIFISSHNLNEVQEHCTKVAFIKDGIIIKTQSMSDLDLITKIVTITGNHLECSFFESIGARIIFYEEKTLKFAYNGEISKLIDLIAPMKPSDLIVENSSLEDEFLTYYEGGQSK